ncbi:MAG: azurin [Paraglaciecola sp.]|nr:azurin [Paraglaciecola sp.]
MRLIKSGFALVLFLSGTQVVLADDCKRSIGATDMMSFSTKEMQVPASCKQVTVTLNHVGTLPSNVMGHNWVLSKTGDIQAIATAGMTAGLKNNYLPPSDKRVIAFTKVIGGGGSVSVTFSLDMLSASEEYSFFCSFPGHWAIMKGRFKII